VTGSARPWPGLHVAIPTPFAADGTVDRAEFVRHARWLAEREIRAIVVGGSLGEGGALTAEERRTLVADLVGALPARVSVIAAVGALTTSTAVDQARDAQEARAAGLLVLPPYVYRGDRRETLAHFAAILEATTLPSMLYNNPIAYGTDVDAELVESLARAHPNLTGVKESSGEVARIAALRSRLPDRLDLAVGLDEAVLDGVRAGAVGWVAGLANALPDESLALFRAARDGPPERADALYRWFRPLLHLDTVPKFVQEIKLVTAKRGFGSPRVRAPRLELAAAEAAATRALLAERLAHAPALAPERRPSRAP